MRPNYIFYFIIILICSCSQKTDDDSKKQTTLTDKVFIVVQKNEEGNVEPRGFGRIQIREGKPYLWKSDQIVLFRSDATIYEQSGKEGFVYRLDDNLKLIEIGRFDLNKTNIELQEKLEIIPQ